MNGKGDAPRPVNGDLYRAHYVAINWMRKCLKRPHNDREPLTLAERRVRTYTDNRALDDHNRGYGSVDKKRPIISFD